MKHLKKINNFGSSKGQRNAALNNLAKDLIKNEFMTTTVAKAKAVRAFVDGLISKAKSGMDRRVFVSRLQDEVLTDKVYNILLARYKDISGGYIEEYKLGNRSGDGAQKIKLMLKGYTPKAKSKLKKVKKEESTEKVKSPKLSNKSVVQDSDVKKDQVSATTKQRAKSRSGL